MYNAADFRKNIRRAFNEADNGREVLIDRYGQIYQLSSKVGTPNADGSYGMPSPDKFEDDGTKIDWGDEHTVRFVLPEREEPQDHSNLVDYAEYELKLAGLFDKDSDYDGMLGEAVLELVKVFSKQRHSGFSAHQTLKMFNIVASYKPLTPIGKSKDEWVDQSEATGSPMWQNKRRGTTFSRDAGKTWYDIDDPKLNNGDTWKPKKRLSQRLSKTQKPTQRKEERS